MWSPASEKVLRVKSAISPYYGTPHRRYATHVEPTEMVVANISLLYANECSRTTLDILSKY